MLRLCLALVAFALLAASLAACGEDERAAYRKAFQPVNGDIVLTGGQVDAALRSAGSMTNDAEVAARFATLAADAAHIAGRLAAVTPTDDVAEQHRQLVSGVRRASGGLSRISQAAIDGDAAAARTATAETRRAAGNIRKPRQRIVAALDLE